MASSRAPSANDVTFADVCNDYEQHVRWADSASRSRAIKAARSPQTNDIRINDAEPVIRATGDEIELAPVTFSYRRGRAVRPSLISGRRAALRQQQPLSHP
jgi:hypothetical protein